MTFWQEVLSFGHSFYRNADTLEVELAQKANGTRLFIPGRTI